MRLELTDRDLRLQLEDMQSSYPRLKYHELFLLWFLHAMVTEDLTKAVGALTGNPKDKGADAILLDERAKLAFLVQGKYHGTVNSGNEHRADVIGFTSLA